MTPAPQPPPSAVPAGGSSGGSGGPGDPGGSGGSGGSNGASSPSGLTITEIDTVSTEVLEAIAKLLPQLSSSSPPPGRDELAEIVESPNSVLFVARDGSGAIVGSLTLARFRIPSGVRAWIEDVVVDEASRGAGIGEALVAAALDRATAEGAKSVDLTSRPSREDANRLYRRMGFEARATNVYRWSP